MGLHNSDLCWLLWQDPPLIHPAAGFLLAKIYLIDNELENIMIHVRFDGRSYDLTANALGIDTRMTDHEIKEQLARHFDVAPNRFDCYVIDRGSNGHLIIRPEAVYG